MCSESFQQTFVDYVMVNTSYTIVRLESFKDAPNTNAAFILIV